jgi:hypothetical protein
LAAEIVNNAVKKIIPLCVEGAKILDICLEGDKLIEQGTGAVWNKSVKGVKVLKGKFRSTLRFPFEFPEEILSRSKVSLFQHQSA